MRGLLLISEGIDSPVAGKIMTDKGMELYALHFCLRDNAPLENVIRNAKIIGVKKLFVIPHEKIVAELAKNCNKKFTCVLCKRMMLRTAELLAKKHECSCIVTGDNLGQVASQTLDNIAVISTATEMPIVRPLLCNDKNETTELAKKFGTYDISVQKSACCTALPKNPRTYSTTEEIACEEQKINTQKIAEEALAEAKEIKIQ